MVSGPKTGTGILDFPAQAASPKKLALSATSCFVFPIEEEREERGAPTSIHGGQGMAFKLVVGRGGSKERARAAGVPPPRPLRLPQTRTQSLHLRRLPTPSTSQRRRLCINARWHLFNFSFQGGDCFSYLPLFVSGSVE